MMRNGLAGLLLGIATVAWGCGGGGLTADVPDAVDAVDAVTPDAADAADAADASDASDASDAADAPDAPDAPDVLDAIDAIDTIDAVVPDALAPDADVPGTPDAADALAPDADIADAPEPDDSAESPEPVDVAEVPEARTFTVMTLNVGTTDNLSHGGDPDGYTDAMADVNAAFYGNNLAWIPARQALRTMFDTLRPDIVAFQELYYEGNCAPDCSGVQASDPPLFAAACQGDVFTCGTYAVGNAITVRQVLGPDYAVACAPNHPDNCVGVRKAFGTLKDCADGPCIDGLDGMPPIDGCTNGARVATAVVAITGGPEVAVVNVHTTAGTNVACRTSQFRQVFEDRGDGKPAAFGAHNIVLGDMNMDPFLMDPEYDASVGYWNLHVGDGLAFHYLSSADASGPNTHPYSFMKLDHAISDNLAGSCVVLGVSEGTSAVLSEGSTYFDHRPVHCTVQVP